MVIVEKSVRWLNPVSAACPNRYPCNDLEGVNHTIQLIKRPHGLGRTEAIATTDVDRAEEEDQFTTSPEDEHEASGMGDAETHPE